MTAVWEYKRVSFVTLNATAIADFDAEGANGWELVGIEGLNGVFKREDRDSSESNWDYEVVNVGSKGAPELASELDSRGSSGWDLVGFIGRNAVFKKGKA